MSASVSTAMAEQATAVGQIAQATEDMRRQSEQTSKGLAEQSRAAADVGSATHNVARQVTAIVRANREQSENAEATLVTLAELRRLGERSTKGVRDAGLAPALAERARLSQSAAATTTSTAAGPVGRA
jgi:methyl-accepting chemotaxis protein